MTNLSTSSGFCSAEVKLWGLIWGKEPLYPTSKPHLNPDTSFCFWPLSYPSSHASSLDALTGVGSLLGCTPTPFFVWSSWGWGGVLKGLPIWRIPHVPSTKKPRHDFVWRQERLGAVGGWVACQAVVAFVLELALGAFPALPCVVVMKAGSLWRLCQGLLGPGGVACSVICAWAFQVSFHVQLWVCWPPCCHARPIQMSKLLVIVSPTCLFVCQVQHVLHVVG